MCRSKAPPVDDFEKKKKNVLKWFEWRKIKERLNGVSKHRLYEVLMDRMLQVVKRTEWAD